MNKYEFLNELRNYLREQLEPGEVQTQIDYYRKYIEDELAAGRSESDILNELGEPRIVGKTIIDAVKYNRQTSDNTKTNRQDSFKSGSSYHKYSNDNKSGSNDQGSFGHGIFIDTSTLWGKVKIGAIIILLIALIIVLIRFAVRVLIYLLPVIAVLALITWITNRRQ